MTIAGREWLVAIAPIENGLLMEMLRYADELRNPKEWNSSTKSQARFILSNSKIIIRTH